MAVAGVVFKCGNCGAALPQVAPGQVVTCPYCGTQQVFPMPTAGLTEIKGTVIIQGGLQISGGGLVIQGGGLVIRGGGGDFKSNETLWCSHGDTARAVDPELGFVVVGLHGDDETPGRKLRAIDAWQRRVLWEVDPGFPKLEGEHLAIRARRLYASCENVLYCLDLRTGQLLWQARLPDATEGSWRTGMNVCDPYPASAAQAAVVVETTDDKVTALDRATGAVRWTVPCDDTWRDLERSPEGLGIAITGGSGVVELMHPAASPQPVLKVPASGGAWNVSGGQFVVAGRESVSVVEVPSCRVLYQGGLEDDMYDNDCGVPVLAGGLVWVANDEYLSGHPRGRSIRGALMPGHKTCCLGSTADTLLALIRKDPGTPRQVLCAFDPQTLAPRYAQQDVGKWEEDRWGPDESRQVRASGCFVLVVAEAPEVDGNDMTDLFGIDGRNGAILWKKDLPGETEELSVEQGYFRIRTDRQTLLFRPDNGTVAAKFPWND
jgi:DNA-directed RNA polymerase subunit RPC12/RpoP